MATDILQKFKEQGIELWAEGDKLRFRATKGVLTPSLREELVNHKEAILRSLFWTGISSISDISQITPASQERYQPFPLTEIQQAYLLGRSEIFSLSGVSAHAYQEFEAANINIKQLNQSLNRVIAHHDMLRAIVLPSGEQKILEQVPEYEIKFLDLRGKSLQEVDSCLEKIRSEMSHQVLPTDKWPLFEIRATQINEEITLIHLSTDLLICDAYSNQLLIQEWFQVYHQPDIQLVGTEFSFRDYVLALASLQDSQLYQRSQAYWQKRLSTLPLAPDLPLVKQVSSITKPRFVRREGKLDSETWRKLKHKATQLHITGSGLLCAAFSEVLAVWNPNPHFTLNLTLFNRLPLHPEVEQILGDFTTTILLEVNQSLNTFTTRAQRLQQQIWEDLEYSQISGVQVLRELAKQQGRSSSGILMPVVFSSALFSEATQPQETATIPWKEVYGITQTPQVLLDHQVREDTGALIFNWDSVDEVFPPGMLDDMFAAYYQLLELLACDDSAWQQPTRQLVPQTQLEQQAVENATAAPISRELLHTLFATQVKAQRYSKAIVSHKRTMTYEELSDHAHQIGHQLRQLSVRPNQLVAVVIDLRKLLFPDGSWKTAESLYALNPFTDYHNSIAQEILRVVVGDWNQDRPLQILEVGAGTGGTTAALLPVLLLGQAVYTYTDISQFFTNQAQDKFKNYSFIEYGILDVDKNPVHQGYEPHSFDVIVAANVIHNARNVDKTLEYLRSLLTPNGILLLLEVTKNSRTQMVTVGFIEQFTHLEDERKKTKMPLLSVAEWGKALDQAGFEEFVAFPESKSSTEALEQHLIVAKAPAHVRSFQPSVLHTYLHNKLPEYMLPSAYVLLETLPLSTNGKIDRKALPEFNLVKSQQEKTFVLPRTSLEKQLVEIWADILNIKQIGIHDNFFEIGGDSLLAIQVSSRVRQAFCVELPLRRLLDSPTIAGLAKYIQIARQEQQTENETVVENLPSVVPQLNMRFEPFSLTDIQQAYWVGRMGAFELGNVSTHIYLELLSRGLDLERLNLALQKLIERHDMLRAIILPDGQQQVLEKVPLYQIEILDLSRENEEAIAAGIDRVRQEMSHKVRPANQWPLFEFRVTLLNAGHVRLHVSIDAIILDGYSILTLFKEWSQLYEHPELALPPLEISFRNYIQAEQALRNTELYRRSQDYWFNRLDTLPKAPELPLAQKPHQQQLFKRRVSELDKTLWQQLNQRAAKAGITASGVLIAAFAEILTVWSKSPDFTINLTLFNRLPLHPQVNNLIGDFTSLNLLEVHNDTNESFSTRATRIQKQLWQDLEHRYVTGVEVLREMSRRQGGARVTMPVVFTSALVLGSLGEDASVLNHFGDLGYSVSQTPQVWLDHQVINKNGALVLIWDAVEELFPEGLLDEMYESYCNFLKRLATSDQEWIKPIRQLVPTTNLELQAAVNATAAPVAEELLHTMFLRQVQVRTHSPAVITSQQSFTYQELFTRANSVGHRLRKLGVSPNQLVAVVMEKGWEQIVAVLGILMSGAAYLPIDPELPTERRLYLLTQGEAVCILTQSHLNQDLEWPNSIPRLCLDDSDDLLAVDKSPLHSVQSPEDLAYVIYTSGSTGLPKGVMIDHRGAVNTITDINQRFGIGSDDKILALSSLNFDLSVYDIFGTLAAGGTIVIPDASARKYPAHWLELMQREQVTVWNSIPTLMQMLVEYAGGCQETLPISLRLVMLSGDWIPLNLPNLIKAAANQTQIVSLGGATEASIWSICYPIETVDRHWKSIPYGKPLQNQRLYVLKESLEPCPVWAVGQLYIGGIGLAQGYWHDEQKTNSSFIIHPHTGERLYQTGDLGRYLPDGNIEFLGRVDSQVKIRGHRIELGEVEATLAQHPAIRSVAVVAVGDDEKSKDYLVAYVVPDREQTVTEEQLIVNLRTFLKQKLPEYMIPSAFLTLETLPLNPNGKVDRKALVKQTYFQPEPEVVYVAPQNEVERIIAKVFQELMQVENVGLYDNFFHLGANSLHLVRLHSKLQEIFHQDFAIATLFQSPTIYALAQHFNAYHAE
ncbi:non-ribosomal peptide synthetase [Fischerella thermalis]|uniref:Carrier domain-containing protein n=1 Tax=Fischerella thermalis CCMEE 5318 TaxID=2019666 RepID=A0A2N6LI07_9CYAN|nr:non-ribosomal peptide synthetase [Fischerella thermalis]PMB23827.1 hypothetical protein CEN46_09410 [Fischerella thermalis CCMEE 5318]